MQAVAAELSGYAEKFRCFLDRNELVDAGFQRRSIVCNLGGSEARGDVLRAVPVVGERLGCELIDQIGMLARVETAVQLNGSDFAPANVATWAKALATRRATSESLKPISNLSSPPPFL